MIAAKEMTDITMVENWNRRTEIVGYCVNVVDQSLEEKRTSLENTGSDPATQRKIKGALFAEEVKARIDPSIILHSG